MNILAFNEGGKKIQLTETGGLTGEIPISINDTWTSLASVEEEKNTLAYTLGGVAQKRIRVNYSFNDNNQLVASILKKDNPQIDDDSNAVLAGGITTDSDHNIVYNLIDANGNMKSSITIYGTPSLENPFVLKIELAGGGEASITADPGADTPPLVADKNRNNLDVTEAKDEIGFFTGTSNDMTAAGGSEYVFVESNIFLPGTWGIGKDGLFFDVKGGTGQPIVLVMQGSYKAVSGGIVVEYENGDLKCALNIFGEHTFDNGNANWNLQLGYTQNHLQTYTSLKVDGNLVYKFGDKQTLTLSGSLKLQDADATTPSFALEIDAKYEFAGGECLVKASYTKDGTENHYCLGISGTVAFQNGKLTYNFSCGADQTISAELTYNGTSDDFLKYFNLKVDVDSDGHVSCSFSFHITFRYENGTFTGAEVENNPAPGAPG